MNSGIRIRNNCKSTLSLSLSLNGVAKVDELYSSFNINGIDASVSSSSSSSVQREETLCVSWELEHVFEAIYYDVVK